MPRAASHFNNGEQQHKIQREDENDADRLKGFGAHVRSDSTPWTFYVRVENTPGCLRRPGGSWATPSIETNDSTYLRTDRMPVVSFLSFTIPPRAISRDAIRLRLYEDQKNAQVCHRKLRADYFIDRDERNIHCHDSTLSQVFHTQFASIPLDRMTEDFEQLPVKLFHVYVTA